MSVGIVRPKVTDLVFLVYSRPLHPELFDMLRAEYIHRDDFHAHISITDSGHIVRWQHNQVCITELVTRVDNALPQKRRLLACRLRGERTETIQCAPAVMYQTSICAERLQPEVFPRIHDELECDALRRGLFHSFRSQQRLALSPLSHIAFEPRANSLLVQAFHTFPDDFTILKSQSLFEFKT